MIEAIIFDLGKVIVSFDFAPMLERCAEQCDHNAAEIRALVFDSGLLRRYETGRLDDAAFYDEARLLLGLRCGYEEFMDIWTGIFDPRPLLSEDFIKALAARYRLVMLSDTCASHVARLRRDFPLLRHFHDAVFSFDTGVCKPDAAMFRAAVARAGVAPERCFYTDDREPNVAGARDCGLHAVLFQSQLQLEIALRANGVSW